MGPTHGNKPNPPTKASHHSASLPVSNDPFPQSLEIRPPSNLDEPIEVNWVSPHNSSTAITFLIEPGTTDFNAPDWEEGIKEMLLKMGADTLEADTAKGESPFACKFFQKIAANYEFKSISDCALSGKDIPLLRVGPGQIHNFTIEKAVVRFHVSSDCTVDGMTCKDSHVRMFCEGNNTISGLEVDESSYLSGSFKGSTFGDDCQIHGYAIGADFTDTTWEHNNISDLADRLDGMRFSWDYVPRDLFIRIAEDITIDSLDKDFKRLNERFSDQKLNEYFSLLETDWGCKKNDTLSPTSPLLIKDNVKEVMQLEIVPEQKCILEISKGDNLPRAGSLTIESPNPTGTSIDVYPNGFAHRAEAVDALLDVLDQKNEHWLLKKARENELQQLDLEEARLIREQTRPVQLSQDLEQDIASAQVKIENLRKELDELTEEMKNVKVEDENLRRRKEELVSEWKEIRKLRQDLNTAGGDIDKRRVELEKRKQEAKDLKKNLKDAAKNGEDAISAIQDSLKEKNKQLEEESRELNDKRRKKDDCDFKAIQIQEALKEIEKKRNSARKVPPPQPINSLRLLTIKEDVAKMLWERRQKPITFAKIGSVKRKTK
ncbi:MAG: hypothetical protein GX589_04090 [Deltaproteobacteria bacterium]|nr:hypothetical protein [Deltaproteobacteria bacterium]